jgi:hypothetical protein
LKRTPANYNLIEQTRNVWQRRLGRNVSREDAREIAENVCGFFKILTEWSRAEIHANDNCDPKDITGTDEGGHDR